MNIIFKHSATKFASIHLTEELLSLYNGDVESALNVSVPDTIDEFVEITDEQLNKARQLPLEDWRIVGGEFVVEPNLERMKAEALENVKQEHAKQLNELTGQATIEERDTWITQREAAENYLLNTNTADQEFLEGLLTPNEKAAIIAAGGSLAGTMANKILSKVHKTKKLIQFAGGMKRTAEEAINAATSVEDLGATITALKAQEQTTLAEFLASLEGS